MIRRVDVRKWSNFNRMIPNIPDTPQLLTETTWMTLLLLIVFFLTALLVNLISFRIARAFLRFARLAAGRRQRVDQDNIRVVSLLSGLIKLMSYILATLASLSLFIDSSSLIWFVGLFSAGFGIAARPIISDYLTGISLIFENSFEIGEKIELSGVVGGNVEGVVEEILLRTTKVRARSGEPIIVPNGEIRVIRNFSRATYSESKVKIRIRAQDTHQALDLLDSMADEAVILFDNLIEPWTVLSESGELGSQTVLEVVFRAKFGKGAIVRPKLLSLVQERFSAEGILLRD